MTHPQLTARRKKRLLDAISRTDFRTFCERGFAEVSGGNQLSRDKYTFVVGDWLGKVFSGEWQRFVLNLPPRHAKTTLGICLAAWFLAHYPNRTVMIVSCNETLAKHIAAKVRQILGSQWLRAAFPHCRVDNNWDRAGDFHTTKGGGLFATHMGGSTGRGADLIIADDPHAIGDETSPDKLAKAIELFDHLIQRRLNSPVLGLIVVIAQRIHRDDLSGILKERRLWTVCALPFIGEVEQTFVYSTGVWERKVGELLRPGAFSDDELEDLRAMPGFGLLYQQRDGPGLLSADDFCIFSGAHDRSIGAIISVDTAQGGGGDRASWSVAQVWQVRQGRYYLLDQWRSLLGYRDLKKAVRHFHNKYMPSVVLVEDTGVGSSLLAELPSMRECRVVGVSPRNKSKLERLQEVVHLFKAKCVFLPQGKPFLDDILGEASSFPAGPTDQIDAITQLLYWAERNPEVPPRRRYDGYHGSRADVLRQFGGIPHQGGYVWSPRR